MDREGRAWAAVTAGVVLAGAPVYWPLLRRAGVAAALDWPAALGALPAGVYPAGVGGAYLAAGALLLGLERREPTFRAVAAGSAAGLGVVVAAVAAAWWAGRAGTPVVGPLLAGLAVGPVLLGLPAGAAPDRRARLLVAGAAVALLAPFVATAGAAALNASGMGRAFTVLALALLVALDAGLAYPLYLAGRLERER